MSNVQVNQRSINVEGVRELKVPVADAVQALKKNGLDEIFFSQDGKNYVAYGDNIRFKELKKGAELTVDGKPAVVLFKSDETASVRDGVKKVLIPTGAVATVGGAVTTAILKSGGRGANTGVGAAFIGVAAGLVTVAAAAAVLGSGALYGAVRPSHRATLDAVAK